MSTDKGESEIHTTETCSIIKPDKIINLNNDPTSINQKTELGLATREELLKQIKHEINMLEKCQFKIDQQIKENEGEHINTEMLSIKHNHINDMYINMFQQFPIEKTLLSEYIEFCSVNPLFITKHSTYALDTLISGYHSDPELYIIAANHEFDDRNDIESARRHFEEGLKYHKNCKMLYIEDFWVEVQHLEKTADDSHAIAIRKYSNLIKCFEGDLQFHFILLDKAIKFNAVGELQCNIVRDMVKKYKHSELMWQKLAKLNFDGYIYHAETEQLHYDTKYINGIRNCIKTYENGLKANLSSKNKVMLWNFYIDHILEIRKSYRMQNEKIRKFMNKTMERVFQKAHSNTTTLLTAEHYIYWAENTNKSYLMILKKGLTIMKYSLELRNKLISYYLSHENQCLGIADFYAGIEIFKGKSLPLWNTVFSYTENYHQQLVHKLYLGGSYTPFAEINCVIRPEYLKWSLGQYGLNQTRKLFFELKKIKPECKQLYTTMISLEQANNATISKVCYIRKYHNNLCNIFGFADLGVWVECMRYECLYGNPRLLKKIYRGSLKCLKSDLKSSIIEEFEKIKAENVNVIQQIEEGIVDCDEAKIISIDLSEE